MERIAAQLCLLTGFLQVLSLSKSIRFIQVVLVSDIPSLPSIHPSILPYFFDILPFDPGIMTQNSPPPRKVSLRLCPVKRCSPQSTPGWDQVMEKPMDVIQ